MADLPQTGLSGGPLDGLVADCSDDEFRHALDGAATHDFATAMVRLDSVAQTLSRDSNTLIRKQQLVTYGMVLHDRCTAFLTDRRATPVVLMLDDDGVPTGSRPLPDL